MIVFCLMNDKDPSMLDISATFHPQNFIVKKGGL